MHFTKRVALTFSFIFLSISLSFATVSSGENEHSNQFSNYSYLYQKTGSGGNGDIKKTSVLYNSNTKDLQMNYSLDESAGVDFMWSVISTGTVKGSQNHAILYTDLKNKTISAYRYDTALGGESYKNGDLLATFRDDGKNMISDTSFTINVGALNNAFGGEWEGVEMGHQGGIWFHTARDSDIEYDIFGNITSLEFDEKSFVDEANFDTTAIPAPFGFFAILAAFGFIRLKRRA